MGAQGACNRHLRGGGSCKPVFGSRRASTLHEMGMESGRDGVYAFFASNIAKAESNRRKTCFPPIAEAHPIFYK